METKIIIVTLFIYVLGCNSSNNDSVNNENNNIHRSLVLHNAFVDSNNNVQYFIDIPLSNLNDTISFIVKKIFFTKEIENNIYLILKTDYDKFVFLCYSKKSMNYYYDIVGNDKKFIFTVDSLKNCLLFSMIDSSTSFGEIFKIYSFFLSDKNTNNLNKVRFESKYIETKFDFNIKLIDSLESLYIVKQTDIYDSLIYKIENCTFYKNSK